ncbi:hypothetical protein [Saccharopolyspora sp. SCSIO 74807]|uniref:hypothetical protein n=1 Tax=Saccharopolyspora sp. SCSIO 74807 TaxID=3118084 RepID=UPI0030D0EA1A
MAISISPAARSDVVEPDLAAEARFFSEHMGWPITIDVQHQRLVMRTGDVCEALILPRSLAEPVALELASSLMSGPVSRDNRDRWWTVITEPRHRANVQLPHELHAERMHAVPPGGELIIPPRTATMSWWQQPQPTTSLPPWSAVVATARRVLNRT